MSDFDEKARIRETAYEEREISSGRDLLTELISNMGEITQADYATIGKMFCGLMNRKAEIPVPLMIESVPIPETPPRSEISELIRNYATRKNIVSDIAYIWTCLYNKFDAKYACNVASESKRLGIEKLDLIESRGKIVDLLSLARLIYGEK